MNTLLWVSVINKMITPYNTNNFMTSDEINLLAYVLAHKWHHNMVTDPDSKSMEKYILAMGPKVIDSLTSGKENNYGKNSWPSLYKV